MAEAIPVGGIRDCGEAMMTSMTGALALFLSAIPKIIGVVIILQQALCNEIKSLL